MSIWIAIALLVFGWTHGTIITLMMISQKLFDVVMPHIAPILQSSSRTQEI